MINRKGGEGPWTLIETPIDYHPAMDGYSQTMIPLGDGQEILQLVSVNNRIYTPNSGCPRRSRNILSRSAVRQNRRSKFFACQLARNLSALPRRVPLLPVLGIRPASRF